MNNGMKKKTIGNIKRSNIWNTEFLGSRYWRIMNTKEPDIWNKKWISNSVYNNAWITPKKWQEIMTNWDPIIPLAPII